ncbi:hypothetical protein HPP92_016317 [Vanilla planifolia]|uniref:Uncharacterized protein n=1 Tax=Vanilla planifolia TaxID=51239 RepID=A0A835QEJ3_VANPL|nr:hypothetical protein HPP92_016317 [Vanilla planifolia]
MYALLLNKRREGAAEDYREWLERPVGSGTSGLPGWLMVGAAGGVRWDLTVLLQLGCLFRPKRVVPPPD